MKAMVNNDTRVLDCSRKVPKRPNKKPFSGVAVLRPSSSSRRPPASCLSPSSRHCMPNKKSASPAHKRSQPGLSQKE
ncbi:hypothetical protein SAMN04244547_00455 [Azotobacter vinelandii]|nr:hypothetical protein SAMN04244547_00455 [Azotobacter vinelandii]